MKLLWFYTSEMASDNDWFVGSVQVRAHYYEEVPQNYTVKQSRNFFLSFFLLDLQKKLCLRVLFSKSIDNFMTL